MTPPSRRLLFVVHSAKLAGAQRVALGQARALAGDFALTIAVEPGPLRGPFAALGTVVRGPTRMPVWGASRRRWALEAARAVPDAVRLATLARRRDVEAIVANSTTLVAPVLAGLLAGVPVVVHAQEAPTSAAARRLFRFHRALATTVVAISPWIATTLRASRGRARVLLNPVGVPVPPWSPRAPRDPGAPLRALVVGTIDVHKRQDVAIRALASLPPGDAAAGARLVLVGPDADPAYARGLRALARETGLRDRVRFAGPSADVAADLAAADVLLVPAGEVTPLVLMEAMARGVPVVAARMGSIPAVVEDGRSGLLVPPGDAPAMGRALRRIATDPVLADGLSAAGRRRVETDFDEARSHARLREELDALHRRAVRPRTDCRR